MKATFAFHGAKELDAVLANDLPKATARAVLRRALLSAAEPMASKARALAPDDPETIDSWRDLKESIVASSKAKGAGARGAGNAAFAAALRGGASRGAAGSALRAAIRDYDGARVQAYVGPRVAAFHGIFQEFGTVNHPPQPFLRPAFDSDKDALLQRLKVDIADEINKAVARAQRKAARLAAS